jgi:hypothetical protein
VAINSTSAVFSDISIYFPRAFSFFLAPLTSSTVLFLWGSGFSYDFDICVSMSVSFSTSSSMVTSCSFVYTSSSLICPIGPPGACSVARGPCVGPCCDLFCVLVFFKLSFFPPFWGPIIIGNLILRLLICHFPHDEDFWLGLPLFPLHPFLPILHHPTASFIHLCTLTPFPICPIDHSSPATRPYMNKQT